MQTQTATQSKDYAQMIADLVTEMPVERAAQAYNFVRFLQTRPAHTQVVDQSDDWLDKEETETEELRTSEEK